jgi:internalin A
MADLDVIKAIEKRLQEPLNLCDLDTVMCNNTRCSYVLDAEKQVIALNLQNCNQTDLGFLKKLPNLIRLNLSLNQITELTVLKKLDKLQQLNLQKNNINNISELKSLANLELLNLQDNQITDIKPLRELKKLKSLNLQANEISEIKYLAELYNLTNLNLSSNNIKDLTVISALRNLNTLNLSSNQIIIGLESLLELSELLELDLRFNQIIKIDALKNLKKLTQLYLSSNKIIDIETLRELKSLTQLYLSSNQIIDIFPLKELTLLTELDLRNNKICQIDALINLKKLTSLYLENNQIVDINSLHNLTELVFLNLRNNQISNIEPLKNLKKLNEIYLSNNKIQLLPRWMLDFNLKIKWNSGGEGISLIANPLKYPSPEVIRQGNAAIRAYFDDLEKQQQRPLNEIKICFVGDSQVGKTSLRKLLCEEAFDPEQLSTTSIEITEWSHQNILAHCWDFGGNEKLHPTQNLFFSLQSVYVLVLDNRQQRNEEYWLRKITYLANDVPVLIVLNKCEQSQSYDVDRKNLIRTYNSLQENSFFSISCIQQLGLEDFKSGLINVIKQQPQLKKMWPESWIQAKKTLENQLKQQYYLSEQLYLDVCQQHGIIETEPQQQFAKLLHDLGVIIHFRKYKLPETYILESRWFIKSLYKIIFSNQLAENNGKLFLKDLPAILKPNDANDYIYTVEQYKELLKLMRNLELCFFIDKSTVLVSQLLEEKEPEIEFDSEGSLKFRIHYEYLDPAIISRLIVALHEDIEGSTYWRSGALLKSQTLNTYALIKVNYAENTISIEINGENSREYFSLIRKVLLDIEATIN